MSSTDYPAPEFNNGPVELDQHDGVHAFCSAQEPELSVQLLRSLGGGAAVGEFLYTLCRQNWTDHAELLRAVSQIPFTSILKISCTDSAGQTYLYRPKLTFSAATSGRLTAGPPSRFANRADCDRVSGFFGLEEGGTVALKEFIVRYLDGKGCESQGVDGTEVSMKDRWTNGDGEICDGPNAGPVTLRCGLEVSEAIYVREFAEVFDDVEYYDI